MFMQTQSGDNFLAPLLFHNVVLQEMSVVLAYVVKSRVCHVNLMKAVLECCTIHGAWTASVSA